MLIHFRDIILGDFIYIFLFLFCHPGLFEVFPTEMFMILFFIQEY